MARELIIPPRLKRDYRSVQKHPELEPETLECLRRNDLRRHSARRVPGASARQAQHQLGRHDGVPSRRRPPADLSHSARRGNPSPHRNARPVVLSEASLTRLPTTPKAEVVGALRKHRRNSQNPSPKFRAVDERAADRLDWRQHKSRCEAASDNRCSERAAEWPLAAVGRSA